MPTQQGNSRDRVKSLCVYSLLTALCIIFGFVESLVPTSIIAPGVKLGLANSVALILIATNDFKGAFCVNIVRILVSTLLFGSPISLMFSLCGGILSLLLSFLSCKTGKFSVIGVSIVGAVAHSIGQIAVAVFVVGIGSLYYLPLLLVTSTISGGCVGIICKIILKKIKTNGIF